MNCTSPKFIWPHRSIDWVDAGGAEKPVLVPCGKCVPCLVNKRSDWCFRLEQEYRTCRSAHFVTLTYDERHLRTNKSLCKGDVQLYLKRLRKKQPNARIRYYAVGEYGGRNGRPHYHLLLFNSNEGDIRSAWVDVHGEAIGIVHIGFVSSASIAYCTKYIIQRGGALPYVEKPFALMSRRYGIGGRYLSDEVVEWHRANDANYIVRPGNVKGRLPRFYREKIWFKESEKTRISEAAMALTLANQAKELAYWQNNFVDWKDQMELSRDLLIARVKQKVAYSQTF